MEHDEIIYNILLHEKSAALYLQQNLKERYIFKVMRSGEFVNNRMVFAWDNKVANTKHYGYREKGNIIECELLD